MAWGWTGRLAERLGGTWSPPGGTPPTVPMRGRPTFTTSVEHSWFEGRDGVRLAFREYGTGRPLVLLHGFTASGAMWIDNGLAARFAEHGRRVIVPDFRGHGSSAAPDDPAAYPPDVLADDALALLDHLGIDHDDPTAHDLAGYSLGGRVVVRVLVRGARPGRAVVGGQGLDALAGPVDQTGMYRKALDGLVAGTEIEPGPAAGIADWIRSSSNDPRALRHVLDSHVPVVPEELGRIPTPVLVLVGDGDTRHAATAEALADALSRGRYETLLGDHVSALSDPSFPDKVERLLAEG
ncbi:alpha/beta hydrolase [Actinomycetospora endophytica]|uniref:Alpha/beta hydrolase n=1 Tax=Actinomycetospora endophytica TaxID=2291215 RepID=A0ABS8P8T5_9PSEU|nr:alpha/beta hydrolase [Actinomycetospora endophytica]MCD2194669.1 alpha/beta hydrolase [Actinomycetospora endophytica]